MSTQESRWSTAIPIRFIIDHLGPKSGTRDIVNWDYVGGSRGAYIIRPNEIALIGPFDDDGFAQYVN